jgi:hypothetical protein
MSLFYYLCSTIFILLSFFYCFYSTISILLSLFYSLYSTISILLSLFYYFYSVGDEKHLYVVPATNLRCLHLRAKFSHSGARLGGVVRKK